MSHRALGSQFGTVQRFKNYDELPHEAQQALRHVTDTETPENLEDFHRKSGHGFELEHVPTEELKRRVVESTPDLPGGDFEGYHRWFTKGGGVPDHGNSRWPVIEASGPEREDGYLADGHHRLHSYVRAGDKTIPVLRTLPKA